MKKWQTHGNTLRSGALGFRMEKATAPWKAHPLYYVQWIRRWGSLPTAEQGSMVITITHRYNKVSWLLFYTVGQGEFSQSLQGTTPQALTIWGWRGVMVNISCIQYQHSHSGQRKGLISLWASPGEGCTTPWDWIIWVTDMSVSVSSDTHSLSITCSLQSCSHLLPGGHPC